MLFRFGSLRPTCQSIKGQGLHDSTRPTKRDTNQINSAANILNFVATNYLMNTNRTADTHPAKRRGTGLGRQTDIQTVLKGSHDICKQLIQAIKSAEKRKRERAKVEVVNALYVATKFSLLVGSPQICIKTSEARVQYDVMSGERVVTRTSK